MSSTRVRAPTGPEGAAGPPDAYDHEMTATQEIIDSIERRLRELNEEIGALTAARDALVGDHAQPPRRRRGAATGRARAAPTKVGAGKLELLLSDTGGLATSALAERANADRDQVLTLLRELETAGRVRRMGQRRATRWRSITDEERIQERAAELSARSRSAA
jgi:hypothetical protein